MSDPFHSYHILVFYITGTDDNKAFAFYYEMNRLASDNEILQTFSKALEVKVIISLEVKSDFKNEIPYINL